MSGLAGKNQCGAGLREDAVAAGGNGLGGAVGAGAGARRGAGIGDDVEAAQAGVFLGRDFGVVRGAVGGGEPGFDEAVGVVAGTLDVVADYDGVGGGDAVEPGREVAPLRSGGAAADAFSRGGGFAAVGGAGVPGPIVPGAGDRVADTDDGAGGGDDVAWEVELVVSRLPARSIKYYFWWAAQRLLAVVTWPVKVRETAAKVLGERTRRRPLVETGPTTFIAGSGMNSRSMA